MDHDNEAVLHYYGTQDFHFFLSEFWESYGVERKRHGVLSFLMSDKGCNVLDFIAIGAHNLYPAS